MSATAVVQQATEAKLPRKVMAIADAFEESIDVAKRLGKHGSDAAEQLMDDTTQRIQRHPAESLTIAFTLGVLVGGFIGWLTRR